MKPQTLQSSMYLRASMAALAAAVVSAAFPTPALAYIGDSFLLLPGDKGHWEGKEHRGWIRVEASDWLGRLFRLNSGATDPLAGDKLFFGGPNAPKPGGGGGKLVVTLSKTNPDLRVLMDVCIRKTAVPEVIYSESSDLARPPLELGARPAEFPAFWQYRLKNVQIADCPVLDAAGEQALVLTFQDIDWLNHDPKRPMANRITVKPEHLPKVAPIEPRGRKQVRSFLVTWIAPATTTSDEECPVMNGKPTEADIYRYLSAEEAAQLRARTAGKGISYGTDSERRGPLRLSVGATPGIVPDPGLAEPHSSVANGIDLDGDDGSGSPPRGIRKHVNYVSPDGRKGIDNQMMRVMGCIRGFRGKRGYSNQTPNARRADGNITTIVEISGIDDPQNDRHVDVALINSMDKPIRDNAGETFIPDYTFRPSDDPNFALYNIRVKGRIVNGVVMTEPIPRFQANPGQGALLQLFNARMRFEPLANGSMKGWLAGYQEWKRIGFGSGYSEGLFDYQAPGVYYALKRNADGLQDPVTGEFNGISVAYEIDTVPAFLTAAASQPGADKWGLASTKRP